MFVSFLIPTRGRVKYLEKLVQSIIDKSTGTREFEILFKLDEDDKETIKFFTRTLNPKYEKYIKYFVTPRGNGYLDIHHYVNFLCDKSSGEWLFIFNDDCFMYTDDWDDVIADAGNGYEDILVLEPRELDGPFGTFPIISKKWYEITNRFSGCMYNDGWVEEVGKNLGIMKNIDVIVDHSIKYDINTGMQYNKENRDITFREREAAAERIKHSAWNDALPLIAEDCEKLKEYIENVASEQLSV